MEAKMSRRCSVHDDEFKMQLENPIGMASAVRCDIASYSWLLVTS